MYLSLSCFDWSTKSSCYLHTMLHAYNMASLGLTQTGHELQLLVAVARHRYVCNTGRIPRIRTTFKTTSLDRYTHKKFARAIVNTQTIATFLFLYWLQHRVQRQCDPKPLSVIAVANGRHWPRVSSEFP